MKFPPPINRFLYRQGWEHTSYDEMLTTPIARMFTSLIAISLISRASRVTFGWPPTLPIDDIIKGEIRQELEERDRGFHMPPSVDGSESVPTSAAFRASVRARQRDGWSCVPVWYCVDNSWHRHFGVQAGMFPWIVAHAADRLVSLNATTENPQPVKWIEYTFADGETDRRQFVEVDLVVEVNGSLTIEFLSTCIEANDVHVSRYAGG